jgi:hypothetical protein
VYRRELQTFVVGLLLLPVLSGCGTRRGERENPPENEQAAAIAEIRRLGGRVNFDEEAEALKEALKGTGIIS